MPTQYAVTFEESNWTWTSVLLGECRDWCLMAWILCRKTQTGQGPGVRWSRNAVEGTSTLSHPGSDCSWDRMGRSYSVLACVDRGDCGFRVALSTILK